MRVITNCGEENVSTKGLNSTDVINPKERKENGERLLKKSESN
jgi:hypothetical protein